MKECKISSGFQRFGDEEGFFVWGLGKERLGVWEGQAKYIICDKIWRHLIWQMAMFKTT